MSVSTAKRSATYRHRRHVVDVDHPFLLSRRLGLSRFIGFGLRTGFARGHNLVAERAALPAIRRPVYVRVRVNGKQPPPRAGPHNILLGYHDAVFDECRC